MFDVQYYSQLNDNEKLDVLKPFEGYNIKNLAIENMNHTMKIVEVVSLNDIVVRLVNLEDDNKSRLEFLDDTEFIYYLGKLNNYMKGDVNVQETKVESYC